MEVKRQYRFSLLAFYIIAIGIGMAWNIIPSTSNILTGSNGFLTKEEYGGLFLPLIIGAIIFSNITGWIGHYKGMKRNLFLGCSFMILSLIFLSSSYFLFSNSFLKYLVLAFGQFVLGAALGTLITTINVYLFKLVPKKNAMTTIIFYALMSIGGALCTFTLDYFTKFYPWQYFALIIAFFFLILGFSIRSLKNTRHAHLHGWITFDKKLNKNFNIHFLLFLVIGLIYGVCENVYSAWGTIFLYQEKNIALSKANLGLSMFWTSVAFGQVLISILVNWVKPKNIYRVLAFLIFLGLLFFPRVSKDWQAFLLYIFGGLSCSAFFPLCISIIEKKFSSIAEIGSGFMVGSYFFGTGFGSFFIGFLEGKVTTSLLPIFVGTAFLAAIMFILATYLTHNNSID